MAKTCKPLRCTLELCNEAATMLKRAGFYHHHTSLKTEATYYSWPGRDGLIRIAAHPYRKEERLNGKVLSTITFNGTHLDGPGKMRIADDKVRTLVALAIGNYFIKDAAVVQR